MARARLDRGAQAGGPACQRQHAIARRREALLCIDAVRIERCTQTVIEHPRQHLARIGRELQFQELLPHLFLAAAQEGDVPDESVAPREEEPTEEDQRVERRRGGGTEAGVIAEIDEAVAGVEA
jgi:hypothetical protein